MDILEKINVVLNEEPMGLSQMTIEAFTKEGYDLISKHFDNEIKFDKKVPADSIIKMLKKHITPSIIIEKKRGVNTREDIHIIQITKYINHKEKKVEIIYDSLTGQLIVGNDN